MDAATQTRVLAALEQAIRTARDSTAVDELRACYDIIAAIVPS